MAVVMSVEGSDLLTKLLNMQSHGWLGGGGGFCSLKILNLKFPQLECRCTRETVFPVSGQTNPQVMADFFHINANDLSLWTGGICFLFAGCLREEDFVDPLKEFI